MGNWRTAAHGHDSLADAAADRTSWHSEVTGCAALSWVAYARPQHSCPRFAVSTVAAADPNPTGSDLPT